MTESTTYINLLLFALTCQSGPPTEPDWEIRRDRREIQVYTRSVQGSKILEFKAVVDLRCDIEALYLNLRDVDGYQEWMPHTKRIDVIQRDEDQDLFHVVNSAPWPIHDRDAIYRFAYEWQGDKDFEVRVSSLPDHLPRLKSVERMHHAIGSWRVTAISDSLTRVEFRMHQDPGGRIPAWLLNWRIVDAPWQMLHNLRNRLKARSTSL